MAGGFERILVPLDGSDLSRRVVTQLRRVLLDRNVTVKLIRVVSNDELEVARKQGVDLVASVAGDLAVTGAPLNEDDRHATCEVLVGDAADQILAFAEKYQPSLIAMASHGRSGVSRWIRGSVAERVLRDSRFPLLLSNPFTLAPAPAPEAPLGSRDLERELTFRRILVPLDGSEQSARILPLAAEIARLYSSQVVLLHVVEQGSPSDAQGALDRWRSTLEGIDASARIIVADSPAAAILDLVGSELFDLVAMTTHGRSGVSRWAFGSVAEHVLRSCASPLLVVRTSGFAKPLGR